MTTLDALKTQRLIFVTGKGGVGKSTVTAALGNALAKSGRKTLILETDTYSAMEDLFQVESASLSEVEVSPNLWVANLRAEQCFVATAKRFLPSERIVKALLQNRVARAFFNAAPSVNEVTILDQIRVYLLEKDHSGRPRFDHIVVDLPASGHAVTFLHVPDTMRNMMRVGPIAKMSGEIADVISDPNQTAIVAVCLPEEMPVKETLELADNLKRTLARPLTLAIVNMVHHPPLNQDQRAVFEAVRESIPALTEKPLLKLIEGNALALGWHDRDQKYLALLHERLRESLIEVPIFYAMSGTDIVDNMSAFFMGQYDTLTDTNMAS